MSLPRAADRTSYYVRQLLAPAFVTVPAASEIPGLFESALRSSGTPPFPVPDAFYKGQIILDSSMKHYLAPLSQSDAIVFSSCIHAVLSKSFPIGTEMVQAGQFWNAFSLLAWTLMYASPVGNLCVDSVQ